MPAPFDRAEYAARLRESRAAMREAGLDVLLVFHQEHMFYLAGYDQIGYWVYQVLIVPAADAPMTAMVRKVDELLVRDGGDRGRRARLARRRDRAIPRRADRRRPGRAGSAPGRAHRDRAEESRAAAATTTTSCGTPSREAELVDASDLVTELRLIKSPAEIACMRRAGEVMDAGVEAAWDTLRPGARECDVHAAVAAAMYRAGGEHPVGRAAHGHRAPDADPDPWRGDDPRDPGRRPVPPGGRGLLPTLPRGLHAHRLGRARPARACGRCTTRSARRPTPGSRRSSPASRTADVARLVHDGAARRGYSRRGQHVGYGIGLGYPPTWIDNLRIKETDPHVLQEGMTFLFHSGLARARGDVLRGARRPRPRHRRPATSGSRGSRAS